MRELVDLHFPEAECIRVVLDNLSTHTAAALYEAFPPSEARRLLRRIEFHYTPKHASWLNMVEIEIGVLKRQCLDRRIDDPKPGSPNSPHGKTSETAAALASNGCSQPRKPAPRWPTPIPEHPTSHNLCVEELGLSEARQAVRLDPNLSLGYQVISFGLAVRGDYAGGLQAAKRAVELNSNDPDSMMALAKAQVRFGDYTDAVANAERARRLHPLAPEYYAYVHGQALYAADRRDESATVIAECLLRAPRDANCLLIQAALQGGRGDIEAAQLTIANLVGAQPRFSLESERSYRRFGNKPLMNQFLKDLTRAKAPETA